MPNVINCFTLKTAPFKPSQLSRRLCERRKITSDAEYLRTVAGEKIEFTSPSHQTCFKTKNFSAQEHSVIAQKIQHLLAKEVNVESVSEQGDLFSPMFLRPKADGSQRLILNLKSLNKIVEYRHFKMDSIWTSVSLIDETKLLHGICGFKGCILLSSGVTRTSKIS